MRIVMIAENDPAGTAILFTRAINRLTDHSCRLVTCQTRYSHAFETDLHIPLLTGTRHGLEELERTLSEAEVFHFHMLADEYTPLGPFRAADFLTNQVIVHHHHGHPLFRADPGHFQNKYRTLGRTRLLVSTPDLLPMLPGATWLPNIVPLDAPPYLPLPMDVGPAFRVCQSPTRKDLKNTAELFTAVRNIHLDKGTDVLLLDVIDDIPHKECLARKQRSHVVFDHMQGYYGVSSLEGLSQGRAVIAGLDDFNQRMIMDVLGCDSLPWLPAHDQEGLERLLRELMQDRDMVIQAGKSSRSFMERHWTEERMLDILLTVYER